MLIKFLNFSWIYILCKILIKLLLFYYIHSRVKMNLSRNQLMALICIGLWILIVLVFFSLSLAPVFSLSMLAIVIAVAFYVQTEKYGILHAARWVNDIVIVSSILLFMFVTRIVTLRFLSFIVNLKTDFGLQLLFLFQ